MLNNQIFSQLTKVASKVNNEQKFNQKFQEISKDGEVL